MFPFTDFNLVFGGFATIAVTVGYTCVKKRVSGYHSMHQSGSSAKMNEFGAHRPSVENKAGPLLVEQPPIRPLKRKFVEDEENIIAGYPYNLASIYPNKRSRTPSSESESDVSPPTPKAAEVSNPVIATEEECLSKLDVQEAVIKSPTEETQLALSVESDAKPEPVVATSPSPEASKESKVELAKAPLERVITAPPRKLGRGFAAFAGSSSPFLTRSGPSDAPKSAKKPIWSQVEEEKVESKEETTMATSKSLKEEENKEEEAPVNALEAEALVPAAKPTVTHLTGEEEEEIVTELKGAKIFIKRGSKDFTSGMLGHVKLLSDDKADTARLLFRREPLWSVSMNVRLTSSVRCTFNAEECVLRVIHKEAVDSDSESSTVGPNRITVYAIKRGRIPKATFQAFAETVVVNKHLKP